MKMYLKKIKNSVRNFKVNPIDNLAVIIPALIVLTMVIGWIVAFIMFIVDGGYLKQITQIRLSGFGFDGVKKSLTNGTIHILYGSFVGTIVKVLLCSQSIIILISFFKKATKVKRVIMIIDLVIAGIIIVGILLLIWLYIGKIRLSDSQIISLINFLNGIDKQKKQLFLIVLVVVVVAIVISALVLILTSESKWMFKDGSLAALSFLLFPLALLLVENIIPLIVGALFLAIIACVIWLILYLVASGGLSSGEGASSASSSSVSSSSGYSSYSGTSSKKQADAVKMKDKNCEYVDLGFLGMKLYRVRGILHDYVERDNGVGTGEVCSLDDLRKGNFHIYDKATGKEIKECDIPWRN
ncbi:hypothetical protein H0486_07900 [Lachnospiraceae bacterium MD1]|uniref:Uncharacterized protein n=1 Tax=Variimorphobacter saccharofermentans TaxID=2755051 RepID=A0A839K032_9FIRM|nr:hypothetical protein [Variimorphobacter saccharofermentans]MBB2182797.1 hypothetical protein [Variimorphobacter saccharofermentans]